MKTLIITIASITISLFISIDLKGQSLKKKFEFEKINNDKSVFLKEGRSITVVAKTINSMLDSVENLNYHEGMLENPPTRYLKNKRQLIGKLVELSDSFLVIICDMETSHLSYGKDSSIYIDKSYRNPIVQKIPFADIEFIEYEGKSANFFAAGMIVSYVTLLIAAPLISYNYGQGTFNGGLYIDLVKYSAISSVLFEIPYFISTPKYCKIKTFH